MYTDHWLSESARLQAENDILKTEIERLKDKCNRQAEFLRRVNAENFPGTLFIHSMLGERDQNNMPDRLLVVPAYGVDFSYVYEKTGKIMGTAW